MATVRRLPFSNLEWYLAERHMDPDLLDECSRGTARLLTDSQIVELCGLTNRTQALRYRHRGLPWYVADRIAARLNTHVAVIWDIDEFHPDLPALTEEELQCA